jgi:molecular chaperone GrpE
MKEQSKKENKRQTTDGNKKSKSAFAKTSEDKKNKYGELEHKYKLALADYQNLLKQTAQDKQEFIKYANEQLFLELIPVYDNLKISLAFADDDASKNGWTEGVKYIIKQFKDFLTNMGVEEIKVEGKKFNPEIMEAVEGKGKKVKKEVKTGYKLNGKIIIPAKVILE